MIIIETPRLILRDHISEDLEPLHATLTNPAVVWYLPAMRMEDVEQTKAYLISSMRDIDAAPRTRYNLAVTDRGGTYLGEVGLHYIDGTPEDAHCGLGYFIRHDRWNLGIATEAVLIPSTVTSISGDPFAGSNVRYIYGTTELARNFAEANGYIFVPVRD